MTDKQSSVYKTLPQISIIGAGNIGGILLENIVLNRLGNVRIFDINEDLAIGKCLDLKQGSLSSVSFQASSDFADLTGSDVVIVTAGVTRKPGMSRDDLLVVNAKVMVGIGNYIKKYCRDAFIIVVTNPLDIMVWLLNNVIKGDHKRIVGMAGVLDSKRFSHFLGEEIKVPSKDIQTMVLGGHGDFMVPLIRYTSVSGIPLSELISKGEISNDAISKVIEKTKNGGAEIVNLFKTTSAYMAPALSVIEMLESYIFNQRRIMPCSVYINCHKKDLFLGLPIVLGSSGVEKIIRLDLNQEEREMLKKSEDAIIAVIEAAKKVIQL